MEREGKIYWLKQDEGGLSRLPTAEPLYAVTFLPQATPSWWSIKIFMLEPGKYESDCLVSFLFDHAPYKILNSINSIDVYDGKHKVGTIYFPENKTDNIHLNRQ